MTKSTVIQSLKRLREINPSLVSSSFDFVNMVPHNVPRKTTKWTFLLGEPYNMLLSEIEKDDYCFIENGKYKVDFGCFIIGANKRVFVK